MEDQAGSLEFLLHADPAAAECGSAGDLRSHQMALDARHARPMASAIAGGFAADRMAWAFCARNRA